MGDVVPFTGEFYSISRKAEDICEDVVTDVIHKLHYEYGFQTNNPEFVKSIAWVVKFTKATIDNELGLANEISKLIKDEEMDANC